MGVFSEIRYPFYFKLPSYPSFLPVHANWINDQPTSLNSRSFGGEAFATLTPPFRLAAILSESCWLQYCQILSYLLDPLSEFWKDDTRFRPVTRKCTFFFDFDIPNNSLPLA